MNRLATLTAAGFSMNLLLTTLLPNYANAEQVSFNDPDIKARYVTFPSPDGHVEGRGYLVTPAALKGKAPAVLVIHENRGLNPYIADVARRLAKAGLVAFAPDALHPKGGYPGNDDEGRALQGSIDRAKIEKDFIAAAKFLKAHELSNGKLGAVGYCFGMLAFSYAVSNGQNVTLLGSLNQYPGTAYTDVWGYQASGREYAFIGITGGTSIIDVTDPVNPEEIVFIQGPTAPPYEWRDFKTHSHYLYIISEGSGTGSGLQIIDLSQLPDTAFLVNTFNQTFTSAHNLYIEDGFAYVVGTSQGGMHILDLSNPTNPVQVGYYGASGYVHDVYVWNDTAYVSSANTYDLVNLTNKSNPQLISQSAALPGIYAHSGWLTEDKRYFIACEEFNVRDITVWVLQDRSSWDIIEQGWQMTGSSPDIMYSYLLTMLIFLITLPDTLFLTFLILLIPYLQVNMILIRKTMEQTMMVPGDVILIYHRETF